MANLVNKNYTTVRETAVLRANPTPRGDGDLYLEKRRIPAGAVVFVKMIGSVQTSWSQTPIATIGDDEYVYLSDLKEGGLSNGSAMNPTQQTWIQRNAGVIVIAGLVLVLLSPSILGKLTGR